MLLYSFVSPPTSGVEHKLWLPSLLFVIVHFTNIFALTASDSSGINKVIFWLSVNGHLGASFLPYYVWLLDSRLSRAIYILLVFDEPESSRRK